MPSAQCSGVVLFPRNKPLSVAIRSSVQIPGGRDIPLTHGLAEAYVRLIEEVRIGEADRQLEAVKRGLATVVPIHLLQVPFRVSAAHSLCSYSQLNQSLPAALWQYCVMRGLHSCGATKN